MASFLYGYFNRKKCSHLKICDKEKHMTIILGKDAFKLHNMVSQKKLILPNRQNRGIHTILPRRPNFVVHQHMMQSETFSLCFDI